MGRLWLRGGAGLLGIILALLAHSAVATGLGSYVTAGSQAADLSHCVEPTELMRRKHMEFIKHQRDSTVHTGIRTSKHALTGCITCHVGTDPAGQPIPVNRRDQFCGACHAYAAVRLNCFDCHAPIPNGADAREAAAAAYHAAGITAAPRMPQEGEGQQHE